MFAFLFLDSKPSNNSNNVLPVLETQKKKVKNRKQSNNNSNNNNISRNTNCNLKVPTKASLKELPESVKDKEIQSNFVSNSFPDMENSRSLSPKYEKEEKIEKDISDMEVDSQNSAPMPDSQNTFVDHTLSDVTFNDPVSDVLSCAQTFCNEIENVTNLDSSSSLENGDSASISVEAALPVSSKYQCDSGIGSESSDFQANFSVTQETVITPVPRETEAPDSSTFMEVEPNEENLITTTTNPISKDDNQDFQPLSPITDIPDSFTSGQLLTQMMKETLKAITEKIPPENSEIPIEPMLLQENDTVEEASYPSAIKPKWTSEEQSDMKIASVAERDNLPSSPCERSKLILRIKKTYSSIIYPVKNLFNTKSSERGGTIERHSCCRHSEGRSSHSHSHRHKNRYKKKRSKHKTHKHHHRSNDHHRHRTLKRKMHEPVDVLLNHDKSPNTCINGENFSQFVQRVGEVKYKRIKLKYGNNMSLSIDIPPSKHKVS